MGRQPATNNRQMNHDAPSTPESNGRGPNGRFGGGNKAGRGNPHAAQVARLRSALLKAVKPADLKRVVSALLEKAMAGDVPAARELLQRLLGPPVELDILERLEQLEQRMQEAQDRRQQ